MSEKPYGVHLVVNPDYGERLRRLPAGEPVWVVNSQTNASVVARWVRERSDKDHTTGITTFQFVANVPPEDYVLTQLWTIDLHHGHYSHDPAYSWVNVIGTPWSESIQGALDEFGLFEHEDTAEGFIARRNPDDWAPPEPVERHLGPAKPISERPEW